MLCLLRLHGELALRSERRPAAGESGMEELRSTTKPGTSWRNSRNSSEPSVEPGARLRPLMMGDRQGHLQLKLLDR